MRAKMETCYPESGKTQMSVVMICDCEKACEQMLEKLGLLGVERIAAFKQVSPFLACVDRNPDAAVLLMQTGPYSVELALNVRERNAKVPLIWFSDLDFAVTAFRVRASYFGLLPVTEESLRTALEKVQEEVV